MLIPWLREVLARQDLSIAAASSDASQRRYWRVSAPGQSWVLMDAPAVPEQIAPFVDMARRLREAGLNVPRVLAVAPERGWVLLSDLGSVHYLDVLDANNAQRLYGDAIDALIGLQTRVSLDGLPLYDAPFLRRELGIFDEWLLEKKLQIPLAPVERTGLEAVHDLLVASALEQPRVCVHRDYHSRNLMLGPPPLPGILDFQDAVAGPISYDLVSLLRDCYIDWPVEQVNTWMGHYVDLAVKSGLLAPEQKASFARWFDLMGVQRHLKAAGIFARLELRDHKPGYLADIPRTLNYVLEVSGRYQELAALAGLIEGKVLPAFGAVLASSAALPSRQ